MLVAVMRSTGAVALVAPDLSESGKQPAAAIRSAMEHAGRPFGPSPRHVKVSLRDGTQLEGLIKNEDSFTVVLQTFDGEYRPLERRQIRTTRRVRIRRWRRPVLAQRLSSEQKADLVAYLSRQKQRAAGHVHCSRGRRVELRASESRRARAAQLASTYWGSYRAEHFSELTPDRSAHRRDVAGEVGGADAWQLAARIDYRWWSTGSSTSRARRESVRAGRAQRPAALEVSPPAGARESFQINPYNKGVAVLGKRVFVNTLDNNLIALDARSGRVLWEQNLADTMAGYGDDGRAAGARRQGDRRHLRWRDGHSRLHLRVRRARGPFAMAFRHHSRSRSTRAGG